MEERERRINLWPLFTVLVAVVMAGTMYWYSLKQQAEIDALNAELATAQAQIEDMVQTVKLYKFNANIMKNENAYLQEQLDMLQPKLKINYPSNQTTPIYARGIHHQPGILQSNVEEWKRAYNK